MSNISFYNLDYIIEVNEKRLEQYSNAYQKNIDKFTNLLIIYSAIAVFIVPLIQSTFFGNNGYFLSYICFSFFAILLSYFLVFTIRLLIPVEVAYLIEPKMYYERYRLDYEAQGKNEQESDKLIKASYINELEKAVTTNNSVFKRKGLFYYRALVSALIACIPYIFCLGLHFSNKADEVQKVQIVTTEKNSNFMQNSTMTDTKNNNTNNSSTTKSTPNTTTQLPGVNAADVKPSSPQMVKENFQEHEKKVDSGGKVKR